MGGAVKRGVSMMTSAIKNAPKTMGKTLVDSGKSLVGANGGNYWNNLGESALNAGAVTSTLGMTGTKDLGSGNNIDKQIGDAMSPPDLEAPAAPDAPGMSAADNAALKEEADNAKKKGRASTVLGGGSDTGGSSAKKTLLGSL